ncbi:MAG: DUF3619 family protein [Burkholderiaceae bacterium]|nr:DUF3619 family protein [Burkholderiaceae bacterium]
MTTVPNHLLHEFSSSLSPASSHLSQNKLHEQLQDRFGLKVAAQLSLSTANLPHDISERLRVARLQAVVKRKQSPLATATAVYGSGGSSASLSFGDEKFSFWNRMATMLPLIVLIVGLVTISLVQNDQRAQDLAEVDAAMLTDYLPPAAYADPGFVQFLKTNTVNPQESVVY